MKQLVLIGLVSLTFFSCRKDKYIHFDERQLVFVNYSEGQELKFIDTSLAVIRLHQDTLIRRFTQASGLLGYTGDYAEEYSVFYVLQNDFLQNTGIQELSIQLSAPRGEVPEYGYTLSLGFFSYGTYANPDSLPSPLPVFTVNGKTYTDVYSLKVYKDAFQNGNDTATLFHNKEYGVIEMVFPNGKKIVRTE